MFIKKFILIFFSFFLISCGFTPMYKDLKNLDFSIILKNTSGDRKINNMIKSKLNIYSFEKTNKNYEVILNSDYKKNIVAKDTTGAATEYKLTININFLVTSKNINKEFKYSESFNMQSMKDKLEEQDYEENIKNSLANLVTRKFILQLSQIK